MPQSKETRRADERRISYREALTNAFRRRRAYAAARPYSALILGRGSDFLYRQGVLTYLRNDVVHIVNVHTASDTELFIDLRSALKINAQSEHTFKLLHFQDNTLAVFHIARSSSAKGHLIVFNTHLKTMSDRPRVLLYSPLPTGQKQFVRHNSKTLIYGHYTGTEDSEDDTWRFRAFSLVRASKGEKQFSLERFSTADIGSNISFEIYDDYFYVVTSQVTVDAEGQDPTSYYGGCRYALSGDESQDPEYWRIWRRQQREGPIHDLWTVLDLQEDENGHGLVISESRREWQDGFSKQKRTFYTEPLVLGSETGFGLHFKDFMISRKSATGSYGASANDEDHTVEYMLSEASKHTLPASPRPRRRLARHCQPEYPGASAPDDREFSLANTKYRVYNYSSSTFLDIVVDSEQPSQYPTFQKHIRLRVGSRRLASPLNEDGFLSNTVGEEGSPPPEEDERYRDMGVQLWPPLDAPPELFGLLNNDPGFSKLKAASDERSVVYMATSSDPKLVASIIFINFDPAIQHKGLKRLNIKEGSTKSPEDSHMQSPGTAFCPENGNTGQPSGTTEGVNRPGNAQSWARIERAAWLDIASGFRFT
ncbi:hypothetical protein MMC30_000430 [Trapelia coarctata]|nr:hypothetical protein [Trapelia coarctata]